MNVDDPKLTAYALGELSGDEKARIAADVARSPEAQEFLAETQEFAQMLKGEYEAERAAEPVRPKNLIDIRGDRWFWAIARPLSIAAVLALAALIAGVVISSKYRNDQRLAGASPMISLPLSLPPAGNAASSDVQGEFMAEDANVVTVATPPPRGGEFGDPAGTLHKGEIAAKSKATQAGIETQPLGGERRSLPASSGDDKTDITVHSEYYNRDAIASRDAKAAATSGNYSGRVFGSPFAQSANAVAQPSTMAAQPAPAAPEFYEKESIGGIRQQSGEFNTAAYDHILENPFLDAKSNPLSTFSIDVDTASYSNIRRFINQGALPPKDAVRLEEMINYFTYDYPQPSDGKPFSINVDVAGCPWEASHRLVRVGLKGREIALDKRGASNLVFLLDVSGSMMPSERLPLVKQAMRLLTEKLTENDRVAIVVYAGNSGLVLPSTTGDRKEQILSAIESLQSGGSTNGAQGIELAYKVAADNFIKGGVNRVILATDGDFNVGVTSQGDLIRLIEEKAKTGVFLSVLGVGTDNLKDSTMQKLADKGNGNYAYLDSLDEARKVLVQQMNGTLVTIAKDVKIQVEFNPATVASYRLIGYEKRILRKEDFNNDKIDAGEIGAGHTVTALYEVVPAGANPAVSVPPVDPLKYASKAKSTEPGAASESGEMLTVKLRHKNPDGDKSELVERAVTDNGAGFEKATGDFKFAAAVAEFGMLLRDSEHKGNGSLGAVLEWAQEGKGSDPNGYRAGFIELVRKAQALKKS
jgi:Ca-activated chloride channel family protein